MRARDPPGGPRRDRTVINYDRRGRGDSGDTKPYAVEREIEDLQALIEAAGSSASRRLCAGERSSRVATYDAASKLLPEVVSPRAARASP